MGHRYKMAMHSLSEDQKWLVILLLVVLFYLLASPFMFKCTGSLFRIINLPPGQVQPLQNGCPTLLGLALHAVLFGILIRVVMMMPFGGGEGYAYSGYQGLADPGDMMSCNRAQLFAHNSGDAGCAEAANFCMQYPGSVLCDALVNICTEKSSKEVSSAMQACKTIGGPQDYFPSKDCSSERTDDSSDYRGAPGWGDFCWGSDCLERNAVELKLRPGALHYGGRCR
jgi:hypothetical protein